jgi:8-oxo-dGTP pyrophosphatase MutT (NUDIX family)
VSAFHPNLSRQLSAIAVIQVGSDCSLVPDLIRIAAALIDDDRGRLFLVRKRGTTFFMQAGGKIDHGESSLEALARELAEELRFTLCENEAKFMGIFSCPAANEPDHLLEAHLFHIRAVNRHFSAAAELEEAVWVSVETAHEMRLAPFTRDFVLPIAKTLRC